MNHISAFGSKLGSFIGPVANGDPGLDLHSSVRGVESESTSFFCPFRYNWEDNFTTLARPLGLAWVIAPH